MGKINVYGRSTQGVRLIRLDESDKISDVEVVAAEENDPLFDSGNGSGNGGEK